MRALSKKVDPTKHDYNKDGYPTESDWDIGKKDFNKDGKVTPQEEKRYQREQTTTVSETTVKGDKSSTKVTTPPAEPEGPKWTEQEQRRAGFTRAFLKRHPGVAALLKKAIDGNWTEEEFMDIVLTETKWGKTTYQAQREFDLQYYGKDPTTIKRTIEVNKNNIIELAGNAGVNLTDEDAEEFAFLFTRNALTNNEVYDFLATKYGVQVAEEVEGVEAAPLQGTAAEITDALRQLAREYGVTMTKETFDARVQEGISKGDAWQSWVEGQRNVFRQAAKSMYPSISDKLDEYTLKDLADPYLEDAANLLGIPRENMDMTNPKWMKAFSGTDGAPMTREQWLTTLRTDRQYGWTKTKNAMAEASDLGSRLLRAFGVG